MRQQTVLREHTHIALVGTGLTGLEGSLEGVVVALCFDEFERNDLVDVHIVDRCILQEDEFKADGIVQSLLVDRIGDFL